MHLRCCRAYEYRKGDDVNDSKDPIEQYTVEFFQKLFAGADDFTKGLGLSDDQEEYLYERDTYLPDDIKIDLNERAVNYLESHRKEVN